MSYCCGSLSVLSHPEYVSLVLISKPPQTEVNKIVMIFMVFNRVAYFPAECFPFRKSKRFLGNYLFHGKFLAAPRWNTLFPFSCFHGIKLKRMD